MAARQLQFHILGKESLNMPKLKILLQLLVLHREVPVA